MNIIEFVKTAKENERFKVKVTSDWFDWYEDMTFVWHEGNICNDDPDMSPAIETDFCGTEGYSDFKAFVTADFIPVDSEHMKVKEIGYKELTFTDGSVIDTETDIMIYGGGNYADLEQLEDEVGLMEHEFKSTKFKLESVEHGFKFGDDEMMFFVPCYSEQNGYYSKEIDVKYLDGCGKVLQELKVEGKLK